MNFRRVFELALVAGVAGCSPSAPPPTHRVELRRISGDTLQIIPTERQLPYCLVFTQSQKGVTRQLTISKSNLSVKCPVGQPVLGQAYRIPIEEGAVRVHTFLSDQRLEAASVANQLNEMQKPSFNPMDMRLPGQVIVETLDFIPTAADEPTTGTVVAPRSAPAASNSGTPGG